jgi:hypothetical protein
MQTRNRCETFLYYPVDGYPGQSPDQIADHGQVVDDITQRRSLDQQHTRHLRCISMLLLKYSVAPRQIPGKRPNIDMIPVSRASPASRRPMMIE